LNKQSYKNDNIERKQTSTPKFLDKNIIKEELDSNIVSKSNTLDDILLNRSITFLFPTDENKKIINQFTNVLELAVYNKNFNNINFDFKYYNNNFELEKIISSSYTPGKIYIGPIKNDDTQSVKKFCDKKLIFFSFASNQGLAGDCIYLFNFFPQNELEELFNFLDTETKLAFLFPENNYGFMINSIIDDILNKSETILVNRSSYKKDLSNVRESIKELGKYNLRKYELERQKKILSTKTDLKSKERYKKLQKFKTTSDYDFTHILIADYGLNLLKVAPLLTYYDIDPNLVQFLGTGVIDDENFFTEPSLQGTIFPGIEKNKRIFLIKQYEEIYNENILRISTLNYDLIGLLNFVFTKNYSFNELILTLNNSKINFNGIDGKFYFKNNIVERDLDILKISKGTAIKID